MEGTPVECFQHKWELDRVLDLYRARKPKKVLEIGTYHGGTLYHWLQNATPGTHVVSVDSYQAGVDNRRLYDAWIPEGVKLTAIEGDSHNPDVVNAAERYAPYDWVFIDADHLFKAVLKDWLNYGGLANGVVLFHDILEHEAHPEIQVKTLWDAIKAEYVTDEIIEDVNALWGGIGVVFLDGQRDVPDR